MLKSFSRAEEPLNSSLAKDFQAVVVGTVGTPRALHLTVVISVRRNVRSQSYPDTVPQDILEAATLGPCPGARFSERYIKSSKPRCPCGEDPQATRLTRVSGSLEPGLSRRAL